VQVYHETYYSPNFGYPKGTTGRRGYRIEGAGVHITGAEWASNYSHIMNPSSNASYNALIKRDGTRVSLVAEDSCAYSHGKLNNATWPLLKWGANPNWYSLSVSRVGSNQNVWDPPQMESMLELLKHWSEKYGFPLARPHIFGHFEIDSVDRWYCPGRPFFDELVRRMATSQIVIPEPEPPLEPGPKPKPPKQSGGSGGGAAYMR
jgi:N-acetyl-anhydromuramyl-L-alanine amidase AmpD